MKLTDTSRYWMPGQKRFLHLATVHDSIREFVAMFDTQEKNMYTEELTGGHLSRIEDDSLAQELNDFLVFNKVLLMDRPMIPDKDWYYMKPNENK
jgi:hypothetical protein